MVAKRAKTSMNRECFSENITLLSDEKWFHMELLGKDCKLWEVRDAERSRKFWGYIWNYGKEHKRDTKWLTKLWKENKHEHERGLRKGNHQRKCLKAVSKNP